MNSDGLKTIFANTIALAILAGTFYALVLSPFVVEADVKLWLTGASGWAIGYVFGDRIAAQAVKQSTAASAQGAAQALTPFPSATPNGTPLDPATGGSLPTAG